MQKIGDIPNTRADSNGEFTDGNVAGGVPPTILPAEWFNTIQRELINLLAAANIEPDSDDFNQVATAVSKLITDGGFLKTVNNLSEIKTAGAAAVTATLANLGLGDAAKKGIASNAEMQVGTADKLVSLVGLMSIFSKRIFSNADYIRIPDVPGGIIIQWFRKIGNTGAVISTFDITLPVPFPTAHLLTCSCVAATGVPLTGAVSSNPKNNSVVTVYLQSSSGGQTLAGDFLVIGY
ncbi:gp53-like domain-containing protein [Yersinia enterocolitica]|uniref:gp53-like domain-containing protein n=1 Tax=Yersinia enterocolitica TaxID=630 RepID=UPI003F45B971